ncbi:MAG: glycosyltransferase family 2 protein [Algibacter sp.]|uniref:glycosyltransferase family 2 protein n=1 Tax=Algibacter sp. TaxID=1872428 RepID=UPI00260E750D|nr:glycosyltransferase family 2 protein [Algibacter sp.]MDG1730034.1 glycosyltransferase family 2 protein [Algibacter sp.]MDG2178343.1 glycosyltransferase family 2 protein [Algibacter sp.]
MTSKPLLSVHLLTYNCENYIDETLQSILKQNTTFKFEIVIGDDNSTDSTPSILELYSKKNPNLINYKQNKEQLGILKNFKTTLDRCSGDYVFDIAGDDCLKQEYALQKMVDTISKKPNLGFIDSGYDSLFMKTKKVKPFDNKKQITSSKTHYKHLVLTGQIYPIGICYNRAHLLNYVDFEKYLEMKISFEDYPILVDLLMNTDFERINESLHVYRIHTDSYSHKKDLKLQLDLLEQMQNLVKFFSNKYSLPSTVLSDYKKSSNKTKLYFAGFFGDKILGKTMYLVLKGNRSFSDFINYLSSQLLFFRKLQSLFRKVK